MVGQAGFYMWYPAFVGKYYFSVLLKRKLIQDGTLRGIRLP
jgi:hypothetical protein